MGRKEGIQSGIFWGTCLVKYIEERSVITTSVLFYAAVKSQGLEEGGLNHLMILIVSALCSPHLSGQSDRNIHL